MKLRMYDKYIKGRIYITLSPSIHDAIKKVMCISRSSMSAVVESALLYYLRVKLNRDVKKLSTMYFDDVPREDEWLIH